MEIKIKVFMGSRNNIEFQVNNFFKDKNFEIVDQTKRENTPQEVILLVLYREIEGDKK
ncbi:hypothetical protein H3N56_11270 [Cetobacterium sp. 2A]|uniref:hypothetical protein n=1 Tax=Cetobacterium sp. 2A TaxID=2754723 RepID=UPI00163B9C4F|nr:hypothetical protein [Cetobacterium sp. 2A]MBC2857013.1 hypothetical protein [Cetobacterium sp. 2A]